METLVVKEQRRHVPRADLRAVAEVRGFVRDVLRHWGVPGFADTAELLTSELVANALVHTGEDALCVVRLCAGPVPRVRVEVRDSAASRQPQSRSPSEEATSGRGLMLVRMLADAWGVRQLGRGKAVWFELLAATG